MEPPVPRQLLCVGDGVVLEQCAVALEGPAGEGRASRGEAGAREGGRDWREAVRQHLERRRERILQAACLSGAYGHCRLRSLRSVHEQVFDRYP